VRRRGGSAVAIVLVIAAAACGTAERSVPAADQPEGAAPSAPSTPSAPAAAPAEPSGAEGPVSKASVTLYFPSATGDGLAVETRDIVEVKRPDDRGAQIVAALIEGPKTAGALPAVPAGTTLRHLWVREDGNAYVDFSAELASGTTGGSAEEIRTVYAIVDSLTTNVPAIRRVGILVAGRERDTLGHLDLRRPLAPDLSLVAKAPATP